MIREFERDDEYAALNEVPPQSDFEGEAPEAPGWDVLMSDALADVNPVGWGPLAMPLHPMTVEPF